MNYTVQTEKQLLAFLLEDVPGLTRTKAKSLLKYGQISVEGKTVKAFDHLLRPGAVVAVEHSTKAIAEAAKPLDIIFENDELIVINKPEGLLSVPADEGIEDTAFARVDCYLKAKSSKSAAHVVHRLDQDTSGVLLFAKSKELKLALQKDWNQLVTARSYFAVVEGVPEQAEGTIQSYLYSDEGFYVRSSRQERKDSKLGITDYKVLRASEEYALLEVSLRTGRKNQIRVHLRDLGHPVVGDKKYGAKTNHFKRLALHANKLALTHPKTGESLSFESKMPKYFTKLFRENSSQPK